MKKQAAILDTAGLCPLVDRQTDRDRQIYRDRGRYTETDGRTSGGEDREQEGDRDRQPCRGRHPLTRRTTDLQQPRAALADVVNMTGKIR